MNRENKKKSFEKITIRHTHAMRLSYAKYAARPSYLQVRGATIGTTVLTAFAVSIWIMNRETGQLTVAA